MTTLATTARAILATLFPVVNGGTAFTDQLDIKLERRRLDPFVPMAQKRNILMTGTRIRSDQIRSAPSHLLTSAFNRQRLSGTFQ